MKDIDVSNLSVEYPTATDTLKVLNNVSFTVDTGEFCCIIGPSGCGKSTLLRAIQGLTTYNGEITYNHERLAKGTAFVQQGCPLLPWRTVLQNVCLGAEIRNNLTTARVSGIRQRLASEYGLRGFEDTPVAKISGGMAQRVAIARALESSPAILFCDEPFSSIDFVSRREMNNRFRYMCRVSNITTIFVTHNIDEAIFLGGKILTMSRCPSRIIQTYYPKIQSPDSVECRKEPEFNKIFQSIWKDLQQYEK